MSRHFLAFAAVLLWFANPLFAVEETAAALPWKLDALFEPPAYHWLERKETRVKALLYSGLPYNGKPTEVFAYYASPLTLGKVTTPPPGGFPGIVLVHGGGGSAFMKWAALWAERGYAAIAMDISGNAEPDTLLEEESEEKAYRDRRTRLPNGGPDQSSLNTFAKLREPFEQQWTYHAVADAILAHSLLRQFSEVNRERTAITGISWGGYTTCLAASVDSRFRAAVPVYGCGFYGAGTKWTLPDQLFAKLSPEEKAQWTRLWDPGSYLSRIQVPIFFVNGTNDPFFWLEAYRQTIEAVPGAKNVRLEIKMVHGHPQGWAPREIGLFVDSLLLGTPPLPMIGAVSHQAGGITAAVTSATALKQSRLVYTTDQKSNEERRFESLPATLSEKEIHAPALPTGTTIWFLEVTDDRGARVTTQPYFTK